MVVLGVRLGQQHLSPAVPRQIRLEKFAMISAVAQDLHDVLNCEDLCWGVRLRYGSVAWFRTVRYRRNRA